MEAIVINEAKCQGWQPAEIKAAIIKALNWDDLTYCELQYNAGIEYLNHYIPADKPGIDQLVRTRTFWVWWSNHWLLRDVVFLQTCYQVAPVMRQAIYVELNDPEALSRDIHPNRVILDLSYSEMMQQLFDNEIHVK